MIRFDESDRARYDDSRSPDKSREGVGFKTTA